VKLLTDMTCRRPASRPVAERCLPTKLQQIRTLWPAIEEGSTSSGVRASVRIFDEVLRQIPGLLGVGASILALISAAIAVQSWYDSRPTSKQLVENNSK
jgi:hypothetical protein